MIIDVHCHYTLSRQAALAAERFSFEPASGDETVPRTRALRPTDFDSCVSERAVKRWNWRLARWFLRLPPPGPELDQRLAEDFARHLEAPKADGVLPVERFVMLAFDAVHDDDGQCPPLPRPGDRFGSDIYTSNSFIRAMCRRDPTRFLFGASVHPYRRDAVACVEEVFAAGACLLKWIPLHHNIDFSDPRTLAVLRRCADLGLPILVHCGEEFTLTTQCPAHRSIRPLLDVLRRLRREDHMPTVIVAHAATSVTPWGGDGSHGILLAAMTSEFAAAPLLADISSLVTWPKAPYLRRLADRQELHHKLLFGSDFPVLPSVLRLKRRLGSAYAAIVAVPSWPQRAALACRAAGFNEIVFHRAAELLPHVDFFAGQSTPAPA
jgi:hypothetical protein